MVNNHSPPELAPYCRQCGLKFFDKPMPIPASSLRELMQAYGWQAEPMVCGRCIRDEARKAKP